MNAMAVDAGWQVVGPYSRGDGTTCWIWSASADYGRRSEGGQSSSQDRARELAQDAHRRLTGAQS